MYNTRVRKEAETLAAAGYEVRVLSRAADEVSAGVTYVQVEEPRRRGRRSRRDAWLDPLRYAHAADRALAGWRPDVVHAHDLNTLFAGRRCARRYGARLVYDSHELELDSKRRWRRSDRAAAALFERAGIRAAAAVLTVSDAIARVLAERYRIEPPLVLLNSLPLESAAREPLPLLRDGLDSEAKVIGYVGGVWSGRGLEPLIDALTLLPDQYVLAVLGERRAQKDEKLRKRARTVGVVDERLRLHDPVPAPAVPAALAAADVAALPIQNTHLSHYYAMPNKLFDAVMAGVPIAVADLPEMAGFVTERELGSVFDETDPASIARVVRRLAEDPPAGVRDRRRLAAVQAEVAWERQAEKLLGLYERLTPVSSR